MMKVFLATSDARHAPLTVIARHKDEALRIAFLWREAHALHMLGDEVWLIELSEDDLEYQPQLAELALSGGVGVAWWTGEQGGWLLGPPDGEHLGEIAPPPAPVRCYGFLTMEYGGTYVVAETYARAVELLHAYSHHLNGWDAEFGAAVEISPWLLHGRLITLRAEMFAGKTGIGHPCEDGFWRVFPADYEPPLRKRDGSVR